jgi:hypothetical protein
VSRDLHRKPYQSFGGKFGCRTSNTRFVNHVTFSTHRTLTSGGNTRCCCPSNSKRPMTVQAELLSVESCAVLLLGPRSTGIGRRSPDRNFHAGFGHRLVTNPPPSDSLVTVTRIARRSRPHAGPKVKIARRSQFSDDLWADGLKVVRNDRRSSAKNPADLQGGRPKVSRCGRSHSARRSKSEIGKIGSAGLVTEWPQIGHILVTANC